MLARVRERKKTAPRSPLVLVVNWLDASRTGLGGNAGQLPPTAEFADACAQLAAVGRPNYMEVVSDANAFLSRYPSRAEAVAQLVQATTAAVGEVSRGTRVTISYNVELLFGRYGQGQYLPFGQVPRPSRDATAKMLLLGNQLETLALTTYPRAGYQNQQLIPNSYLLRVRRLFPEHKLLVTEIGLPLNEKRPDREVDQGRYLMRLLRSCYWLDTNVIAFPRLTAGMGSTSADFALRVGKTERAGMLEWRNVLSWKRVPRLSIAGQGQLPLPEGGKTGIEGRERESPGGEPPAEGGN
jgi:hypothetical protein